MNKNYLTYLLITSLLILITRCDRWDETADVSHISYLPVFNLKGGEFISIPKDSNFIDPGVEVTVNGKPVNWFYMNSYIDVTTPGVYILQYYAENEEGFYKIAKRIVAVTYEDVSKNDLSGTYTGTNWTPVKSKVTKIHEKGYYKCQEVLGYPGTSMPGYFVDIGMNKLVLLPGEGYFGKYDMDEGSYTSRTLEWDVKLLDEPYNGISVPVTWIKED